jgi:two-component system sensor histidine kinase VicK
MKGLINQSLESHQILASTKNITINATILEDIITGDADKLSLVVNNLLSNAVKYAPQNSEIEVKYYDGYFEVVNDGSIPEEAMTSLFEPFYRVDKARARQDGSTGLGL